MSTKKLHIVSFDVPFPADYGGAIDVFYKIVALSEAGWQITLHCYDYGRGKRSMLNNFCEKVIYYERKTGLYSQLSITPYIVYSRRNNTLLTNLRENNAPILFEGLHSSYYLSHPDLQMRTKWLRTHNIEHHYYQYLSENETNLVKKLYYAVEAQKLKQFESQLVYANKILSITLADTSYFNTKYGNAQYLPPYHPNKKIEAKTGNGHYLIYHGNLSVAENKAAVKHIIETVLPQVKIPIIIAGKNPSTELESLIAKTANITLKKNVTDSEMNELLLNAHIHFLPVFQETGIKLKLLKSLYLGRHILVNSSMVYGTQLASICHVADNAREQIEQINHLSAKDFAMNDLEGRKEALTEFNTEENTTVFESVIS